MNKSENAKKWIDETCQAHCTQYFCLARNSEGRTFLHADCSLTEFKTMLAFSANMDNGIRHGIIYVGEMLDEEGGVE